MKVQIKVQYTMFGESFVKTAVAWKGLYFSCGSLLLIYTLVTGSCFKQICLILLECCLFGPLKSHIHWNRLWNLKQHKLLTQTYHTISHKMPKPSLVSIWITLCKMNHHWYFFYDVNERIISLEDKWINILLIYS